jgi:hypothetical protein
MNPLLRSTFHPESFALHHGDDDAAPGLENENGGQRQ